MISLLLSAGEVKTDYILAYNTEKKSDEFLFREEQLLNTCLHTEKLQSANMFLSAADKLLGEKAWSDHTMFGVVHVNNTELITHKIE